MGRGPDGQNDLTDIIRNADGVRGLQVHRQGGDAAARAQRGQSRGQDVPPEGPCAFPASGPEGIQREGDEEVAQGRHVIGDHGPQVGAQQVGAKVPHQRREVGEQPDGRVVHDDPHQLQHGLAQGVDGPGDGTALLAQHLKADAKEDGEENQRQHMAAGDELREIAHRQGLDDLLRGAEGLEVLRPGQRELHALRGGIGFHGEDHDDRRDGSRHQEHPHQGAHDVPQSLHRGHIRHRAAHRCEDQRHHDHEHGVDKDVPQRLEHQRVAAHFRTGHAAQGDRSQQDQGKAIRLPKAVLLLRHKTHSLRKYPLYRPGGGRKGSFYHRREKK